MQHDVCALSDIPANGKKAVKVAGYSMLLLRAGDTVHAVAGSCSHMNLPLRAGKWDGKELVCRFHGARFDPTNGKCTKRAWLLGSVGREEIATWPVTIGDGRVLIEV